MQELRLVAVSEDGTYLVLATAGRGTRFTLPIDDRLRAAVRGHFSRLGRYEIEVESPLRPKEIQARIRAGETAEDIAEAAGIPLERVRWFEGPVLQEREFMAQQAQRVSVRRPGESGTGPQLGEIVAERLGRRGVDPEDAEWDSWKREDGTWTVRVAFLVGGRPHTADWIFDSRRRHVTPADDEALRLCAEEPVETDEAADDDRGTVRPFVPRLAPAPAPHAPEPDPVSHAGPALDTGHTADTAPLPAAQRQAEPVSQTAPEPPVPAADAAAEEEAGQTAAVANDGPGRPGRARKAAGGRGRRASVPSWDEIMFGARRPD